MTEPTKEEYQHAFGVFFVLAGLGMIVVFIIGLVVGAILY